jgi:hypothetical protein
LIINDYDNLVRSSWFFYGNELGILRCQSEEEVGTAEEQPTSSSEHSLHSNLWKELFCTRAKRGGTPLRIGKIPKNIILWHLLPYSPVLDIAANKILTKSVSMFFCTVKRRQEGTEQDPNGGAFPCFA